MDQASVFYRGTHSSRFRIISEAKAAHTEMLTRARMKLRAAIVTKLGRTGSRILLGKWRRGARAAINKTCRYHVFAQDIAIVRLARRARVFIGTVASEWR